MSRSIITPQIEKLLKNKNSASVDTLMKDGSSQVSITRIDYDAPIRI